MLVGRRPEVRPSVRPGSELWVWRSDWWHYRETEDGRVYGRGVDLSPELERHDLAAIRAQLLALEVDLQRPD